MNYFLQDLNSEQRCAMMGLAIELCGCETPSPLQLSQLEEILYDFSDELGISKSETEAFVRKMESNGRLRYALNVLKSVENNRIFGLIYPNLYSIVATLESTKGLNKLNQIYKDEFGHTDEDINMTWELYEIKDFRKNRHNNTSSHSSATPISSSGTGCLLLLLAIPASLFMFFCGVTLLFNI